MELILAALCGAGVCAFGMWAFLKGQRSMAEIARQGAPEPLHGPVSMLGDALRREQGAKAEEGENVDFAAQVRALFAGPREEA